MYISATLYPSTHLEIFPDLKNFPLILAGKSFQNSVGTLKFAPKFYSLIQNNIGPNFGDGLNFITCEHYLKCDDRLFKV